MKILKTSAICALLCVGSVAASAQMNAQASSSHEKIPVNEPDRNKPHLFADLPQKMKLRITDLKDLLDLPVGASVKTFLADNFNFKGVVVSTASNADAKSVVIKSTNRQGAVLTFTQTTSSDGVVNYIGKIVSLKNGDAFDIIKEDNQYVLEKKNLYDIISE